MNRSSGDSEEHSVFIPNDNYGRRSSCSTKSSKSNLDMNYKDYYEWTASAKEVRPITITENVDFKAMPFSQKLWWSFGTCVQMLTLTVLSIRTDRLLDWRGYLKYHWKHYSGIIYIFSFNQKNHEYDLDLNSDRLTIYFLIHKCYG